MNANLHPAMAQALAEFKHTPGPWKLELVKKWPFGVQIFGSDGNCVLSQGAAANSSEQRTRDDCERGIGFDIASKNPDFSRSAAVTAVAIQDANARRIVACVNACDVISTEQLEHEASDVRGWLEQKRLDAIEMAERNLELKEQRDALLTALEPLRAKFRSGNDVPVERSVIKAKEWAPVEAAIAKASGTQGDDHGN